MAVSADQVATLRAYLSGDREEFLRLNRALDRSKEGSTAYAALITGAFVKAVERRFNERTPRDDVIGYVADVRSRSDNVAQELDPDKAERMIMTVIADQDVDDLSANERIQVETILIAGLVADAGFNDAELDAFLEKSRTFGNELMG